MLRLEDIKTFQHVMGIETKVYPSIPQKPKNNLNKIGIHTCEYCGYAQVLELYYCKKCTRERA